MAKRRPNQSAGVEPSVRIFTTWTPSIVRAAELAADQGYMRQVADLCDWLLGDERIKSCLDTRAQALFGLDPAFERSGDKRRSGRAIRALEADEDWWDSYPEAENSLLVIWGILLGLAPARQRWDNGGKDHDGRVLAKPAFWHPRHLRLDQSDRWMTRIAASSGFETGEIELAPGNGEWILHTPYGPNRPWSMGLWRGLALLRLFKWYAIQDWARVGEKAGILVATADKEVETSHEQRAALAKDIYSAGRDAVAVLPPGFDLKLVATVANSKEIFDAQIAMANEAIAVSIRGGNLSTKVVEGSRAAAEVQERTGDQAKLRFDAQAFTTTIHDQSLVWWAEFNFGDSGLAPWPVYPVEAKKDLKAKADTMAVAVTAAKELESLGLELDREKFAEEFELSDFVKVADGPAPKLVLPMQQPPAPGQDPKQTPPDPDGGAGAPVENARARQHRAQSGADNGQTYVDDVAEDVAAHGAKELMATVAAMVSAVRNAESFDDAKKAILAKYEGLASPARLASLTEAAITMSQMGGHLAVREDIPELED